MKNLHPYGIPHSILFEKLFAKTYDQAKLEEDKERIRQAYHDHGFFQAMMLDETVNIVPRGGTRMASAPDPDERAGHFRRYYDPVEEGGFITCTA